MIQRILQCTLITASFVCLAGCNTTQAIIRDLKKKPAQITIYKHSAWSDMAPKGVDGNGIRMNLAPGDDVSFEEVTIAVSEMKSADEAEAEKDQVTIDISNSTSNELMTLDEGTAINWNGYHVSIVAIYADKNDLGSGSTVFEIATVESLPDEVANSDTANGPEYRLRVKHEIDKLTLHHSATPHAPEDDLGDKLLRMQGWGERDRNWWDLPYHFIIDIDGTILEARDYRYMGDTNTRYDPRGHFLINCYGNYNEQEPNEAQLNSIASLMAWAAVEFDIDPIELYGHRDLAQTSCPGDNLHAYVEDGRLEARITNILKEGQPNIIWKEELPAAP